MSSENKLIVCPICGEPSKITAHVLHSVSTLTLCQVYADGIDWNSEIIDESTKENDSYKPSTRISSYKCESCNDSWIDGEYSLKKNEDGIYSFVKRLGRRKAMTE